MRWTKDETNFLLENCSNKGHKYCSEILKKSISSVKNKANKLNIKLNKDLVSKNMSKNIINIEDYININSAKIAYILGLVWTDGTIGFANNNSKTPIIKHTCVKYDSGVINNIFKELNWRQFYSENKKSIGKNTMSTNWISNRELGNYLINNNYRDKNKGTYIYRNFIDKYISHFVRGLFDGDGCFVSIYNKNKKYKSFSITFSSTSDQNWNFLSTILDSLDVRYKIRRCCDKLGKSSQLNIIDSKSIFNLCEYMYLDSDGIRLERKYKKYNDFIQYKIKYKKYNNFSNS